MLIEEAYYWNYAIHFDFGYLDHPPLVATLIKLSTLLFGINSFGVRCPALLCWLITAYFSYRWSELIQKGAGLYAILLLSILPPFFVFSFLMTPDILLMACWSAALYALYQGLCCNKPSAWYGAGIAIGIGLLAKYTMVFVILTTGIYLLVIPQARVWFSRKEPYLAAIIALILFSPVIYWNATHDWASFAFQSTRRFSGGFHFTFHYFLGLILLFFTPIGVDGLVKLLKKNHEQNNAFFCYYTLAPLIIFGLFSVTREIKFDWLAPVALGIIPWLAMLMQNKVKILHQWFITTLILLPAYAVILFCIAFDQPAFLNHSLLSKIISWDDLTYQFHEIAVPLEAKGEHPVFVAIDSYGIASELTFYQAKQRQEGKIRESFPVRGAEIFGFNSLMFNFWYKPENLQNRTIILIGKSEQDLNNPSISRISVSLSPIMTLWGHGRGGVKLRLYYYRLVRLRPDALVIAHQFSTV